MSAGTSCERHSRRQVRGVPVARRRRKGRTPGLEGNRMVQAEQHSGRQIDARPSSAQEGKCTEKGGPKSAQLWQFFMMSRMTSIIKGEHEDIDLDMAAHIWDIAAVCNTHSNLVKETGGSVF